MAEEWMPTEEYLLASALSIYLLHLQCIAGEIVEMEPDNINLPVEYRWEIGQSTEPLLALWDQNLSGEDADAIRAFASEVERVPQNAPPLSDASWKESRVLATALLARLRPAYAVLEPSLLKDS